MTTSTARQVAAGLAILYAAFVVFAVFWPTGVYASGSLSWLADGLSDLGGPAWATSEVLGFLANIVLFVPISVLGSVLLHRWGWRFWLVVGLAGSSAIELSQLLFLGDRSPTVVDVIANTLGAGIGAYLALLVRPHIADS